MERIKNEQIKEIMGVKRKPDIIDTKERKKLQWYDARGENTKINYGMSTIGEKEKRICRKNVDGRSTSSHDSTKFRTRSMEKQRGMLFGFWEMATAVKKKNQSDR
jgi:hypothetical protein